MISTDNAAGFSGTNAGGDLAIVNSEWTGNLAGIVPNTLDSEAGPPQHDILIAGNDVHDNNNRSAPTLALTYPSFGIGILVTGGRDDQVTGNLVEDQRTYGIVVLPMLDRNLWTTGGNAVTANVVHRSGLADLALGAPSAGGDCFAGNQHATSQPPAIELLYPCGGFRPFPGGGGSMAPTLEALTRYLDAQDGTFPHGDWRTQPAPPPQPSMPGNPANAPPNPAIPGENVPQTFRIRPIDEIRSTPGQYRSEGDRRVGDAARNLVVEPPAGALRLHPAVRPVRLVGRDRDVGPDPPGVVVDHAPGAVDAGRPRGAVRRSAALLRLRSIADPARSCGWS